MKKQKYFKLNSDFGFEYNIPEASEALNHLLRILEFKWGILKIKTRRGTDWENLVIC
jgi:hypothetical protein